MTRTAAIACAQRHFDSSEFRAILARRIAIPIASLRQHRRALRPR